MIDRNVLISRGNVYRAVLTGIPLVATFLLIAWQLAPPPLYAALGAGQP